jgi:nitroreductase
VIIDRIDPRSVRSAIELASHAPSVHNTQPWHWTIGRRVVHLNADRHRRLPATDADGRDLTVSCGAALHHVGVALAAAGIRTTVHRIPDPAEPERLATLELKPGTASEGDLEMAAAITRRRSDRRPFGDRPIPEETWLQVQNAAIGQGAILRPVVGPRARSALLEAIRQAAALQQDVPGYTTELASWSGHHAGDDGVPAANLVRNSAAGAAGAPAARRFAPGDIDPVPARRADGAMLAVLGTASDDTLSQLRAGEALSSVLLTATTLGLASCPLSQPLEIGSTRHILRDHVLEGSLSPQLVLRLGWPPVKRSLPATPRRSSADIATVEQDR